MLNDFTPCHKICPERWGKRMEAPTRCTKFCASKPLKACLDVSCLSAKQYIWISKNQHLDISLGADLHRSNQNSARKGLGTFHSVSAYLLQPLVKLVTWALPKTVFQKAFEVPVTAFKFSPSLKSRLTNNQSLEIYVVPEAAKCGEGWSTRRSSSSTRPLGTRAVEEKCNERDRKMVGKWGRGKRRTSLFFL